MSDQFLPPTGPPVDDELPLPAPDENGLGYYSVDEYAGPGTSQPFGKWQSGRVPFAERNWRIPLIGFLIAATVVIVSVVLLLPGDEADVSSGTAAIELREQPVKQWDEDLDGFASGVATDDTSMYAVVVKPTTTELVALDLISGDQRWATELGLGGTTASGSALIGDDGLDVVFDGPSADSDAYIRIDPDNGEILWTGSVARPLATVGSELVVGQATGGGYRLSPIDQAKRKVGDSIAVDTFFMVDDRLYLDDGGMLITADPSTLKPLGKFRYRHDEAVVTPLRLGDDLVFATGERIVRVDAEGVEKYSFDPQVGIIRNLIEMQGDRVLVGGSNRMRVVSLNDSEAEAATRVRTGVSPVAVHEIEGDEFILVFGGPDTGVAPSILRTMQVTEDNFEQLAEIELISSDGAPPVPIAGNTFYTTSLGPSPKFLAFDLTTGQRLWTIVLDPDANATVTPTGVVVLAREDDESVVTYYAPSP